MKIVQQLISSLYKLCCVDETFNPQKGNCFGFWKWNIYLA